MIILLNSVKKKKQSIRKLNVSCKPPVKESVFENNFSYKSQTTHNYVVGTLKRTVLMRAPKTHV